MEFLKYGIGWLFAIISIAAGAYYFVYNRRRKKLEVDAHISGLLSKSVRGYDQLSVQFNDRRVVNPHILLFVVENIGNKDISSKDFDADKPLKIDVTAEIVSKLDSPDNTEFFKTGDDARSILLTPSKVAAGSRHRVRFLTDGEPLLDLGDNPLIDTDVVIGTHERSREFKELQAVMRWASVLSFLAAAVLIAITFFDTQLGVQKGKWLFIDGVVVGPLWAVLAAWLVAGIFPLVAALFLRSIRSNRKTTRWLKQVREDVAGIS